jgi:hypothetical protein
MKWIVGVSLFAMAMVLGFAATTPVPVAAASIDAVSLRFLPPDIQGIGFIDVAALRDAPLVQDALKSKDVTIRGDLDEFMIATGVDARRDIDKLTLAKLGAEDGFVIAQGRFDKAKIEDLLKTKNRSRSQESYLGQTLYRDGNNAVVIFNDVVLLGRTNAVKKALDQMQSPVSRPLRNDLLTAIQAIEPGNQLWGVGEFSINDLGTVGFNSPSAAVEMLKSLRSGTYQMRVDTGIYARATGNFADPEGAQNIGDLARGMLAIAKIQMAQQQPDVLPMLDGIQVSYTGATLTVRIEATGEQLRKLKNLYQPTIQKRLQ